VVLAVAYQFTERVRHILKPQSVIVQSYNFYPCYFVRYFPLLQCPPCNVVCLFSVLQCPVKFRYPGAVILSVDATSQSLFNHTPSAL